MRSARGQDFALRTRCASSIKLCTGGSSSSIRSRIQPMRMSLPKVSISQSLPNWYPIGEILTSTQAHS